MLAPMAEREKRESDQLPEDAPTDEQVVDDDGEPARGSAQESPGVPGEGGQATGNPDNAG
jgi:hypothetical protein